jgi:Fic family protein
MHRALDEFERFLHTVDNLPPLVKVAYIHAHFETIHPFLDGNGRTGRILIALYLWKEQILEKPVLFLSSYFNKYKTTYYDRLTDYRSDREEKWVRFFLEGIIETAESAIETVKSITRIRERDMMKMSTLNKTAGESGMPILQKLFSQPIVTVATIQEWAGFSTRTGAQNVIDRFIELGILSIKDETKKYGRTYVYRDYLDIFHNTLR